MIILQSNSDSLQIFLGGAVATTELPFYASWIDTPITGSPRNGESIAITSGATVVTAVPAPGINTSRTIKFLSIHNSDTASVTVTIRINTSSYQRILCRYTLAVGDMIQYTEDGFTCTNSIGETKITIGGAGMTNLAVANRTATTLDITSSTGTAATVPQASITEAGLLIATDKVKLNNTSGTNTGDQTITLTGDATGSGTGSFAVSVVKILGNTVPANAAGSLTNDGAGNLSWSAAGGASLTATRIGFGDGSNMLTGSTDLTFDDATNAFYLNGAAQIVTSVTTPLLIGGSAVGSNLTFQSTTGTGTATGAAHIFTGGTAGGTTIATLYNDGQILIGTTTRNPTSGGMVRIDNGAGAAGYVDLGINAGSNGTIWFNQVTPSATNYALQGSSTTTTLLNATTSVNIRTSNTTRFSVTSTLITNSVTLLLRAGTATAATSPIKFQSGTNLTTAETGAVEYDGTNLFFTRTGTTRESVFTGVSGASAPATNLIGAITDYYGSSATRVLTTPNSWASVVIGGTTYKIPLYT